MAERRIRFPSGQLTLEGVLHLPDGCGPFPGVVVCHPHPQYGGDMHNNVVMAIVRGLTARGVAALCFNFRGVGRSGGAYEGTKGEQADARAALAYAAALPELDVGRIGLAGYSFGAMVAAGVDDPSIPALALVALPLSPPGVAKPGTPGFQTGPDPKERLPAYPHPLLLIAGNRDHVCSAAGLQALAAELGDHVRVQIVPGTDHFWLGHERDLERAIGDFFVARL